MQKDKDDYQYNSCISRGICSINPRTNALQRVLVKYLVLISKYALDLYNLGVIDKSGEELILNTIAVSVSNPEFTERSFIMLVGKFKEILPKIAEKYKWLCNEKNIEEMNFESLDLFKETADLIKAIKFGEKDMLNMQKVPQKTRDLFRIMTVVIKSISINLLDLESFGETYDDGFKMILTVLKCISPDNTNNERLKKIIYDAVAVDIKIAQMLRRTQEKFFGKQGIADVSYTTTPSKAVLVVGSNIKELENILIALKDEEIDVYTHDDMMIAHTFPLFKNFPHLKGQYGQGLENCLLDFATFPGPIILTKNSLHNIDNFYRGILFTTDYTDPKGITKIKDNDFSELINACKKSKGFKTGRQCETVRIGYNFDEVFQQIKNKLANRCFKKIFLIGLEKYSLTQKTYFEKLIKLVTDDTFVISFSYNFEKNNLIHINSCFDSFAMVRFFEELNDLNYPITVFVPKCDRNSISQMIYFSQGKKTDVFVGECTPIILNPSLITTLEKEFKIKSISFAKKDFEIINKE